MDNNIATALVDQGVLFILASLVVFLGATIIRVNFDDESTSNKLIFWIIGISVFLVTIGFLSLFAASWINAVG